ncbi:hypothetical protein GQ457_10G022080 [Hibiscus cannabinus]
MERKNLGRRRVEMRKMANENHLQVTFSKRRSGLFKKAGELSTLCGAQVAIVVFSPSKKVYSFGHPSVDTVIDRYLGCDMPEASETLLFVDAHRNASVSELCMYLEQVTSQLDAEKERGEQLDAMKEANRRQYWCQAPMDELDLSQLLELKSAMEELKKKVEEEKEKQKHAILNANSGQFYIGNSSGHGMIPNYLPNNNNNNMAFDANLMNGGYGIPNTMVPTPGYNPIPPQGYNPIPNPNPAEGYNINPVNPAEEYHVSLDQGYNANPVEVSNVNPAQGHNANIIQENDFLDLIGFGSPDFGGGFF